MLLSRPALPPRHGAAGASEGARARNPATPSTPKAPLSRHRRRLRHPSRLCAAAPFTGASGGSSAAAAGGGASPASSPGVAASAAAAAAAARSTAWPAPAAAATAAPPNPPAPPLPTVHVPFRWPAQLGASRVSVFGSWDDWRAKVPLARSPVTGDWVRVLELPLDPEAADGPGRQIEYKFEVVEEGEGGVVGGDEGGEGGGAGGGGNDGGRSGDGAPGGGSGGNDGNDANRNSRRRPVVRVRPCPSDPVIRTAVAVFASDVGGDAPSPKGSWGDRGSGSSSLQHQQRHRQGHAARRWTESHANNKRLLAPNKLFFFAGAGEADEVLATGDFGGWHAAIRLAWNPAARRHEAAAALPAGSALSYRFLLNGKAALAPGGLLPVAPAPPPAPAGRLAHRDAALPPPRAFSLFYATGWPSATLVYRFRLPHLAARPAEAGAGAAAAAGANADGGSAADCSSAAPAPPPVVPVTPWQELPMDVAPSRDSPNGGRWMMAVVEPPPALRRDPWSLERRAEGAAAAAAAAALGGGGGGGGANAVRVAALAAAPATPCELEFFVRGPPNAPPPFPLADQAEEAEEAGGNQHQHQHQTQQPPQKQRQQQKQQWSADGNAALAAPCARHPEEDRGPSPGRASYVLPAPMAWKLSRGRVRKFPRALRPPAMLVSDLDHTLYAEGEQAAAALGRFTHYWETEAALARSVLVYNTGRSLGQFVSLVNAQAGRLALPDVLVTAVGTKVFHLRAEARAGGGGGGSGGGGGDGNNNGGGGGGGGGGGYGGGQGAARAQVAEADWQEDLAWSRRLDHGWDLRRAREAAEAAIQGARERFARGWGRDGNGDGDGNGDHGWGGSSSHLAGDQIVNWLDDGSEHPHRVAVSSHVRATPFIVRALRAGMAARGVRCRVVISGAGDWRYVDAVARRAGKAAALEHVRRLYGVPPERTMAAGDSCNDVLMLAAAADGGMGEALAWQQAAAAAAAEAAAAAAAGGDGDGDGDGAPSSSPLAAAAAMLMMRDYWAGGGSATFLDEASDHSSGEGGGGDGGGGGGGGGASGGRGGQRVLVPASALSASALPFSSSADDDGGGDGARHGISAGQGREECYEEADGTLAEDEREGQGAGGGGGQVEEGDKEEEEEEEDGGGGRAPRVRAVIVGNAQRELVEWYDSLRGDTGAASIVLAKGHLADGVLEGLMRHGLY